jgi:glycosyltransferase involved in cell wall biosynthesis
MRSLRERNPLAYGLQNITSPSAPGKRLIHRDRMQSEVDIVLDGFAQLYRASLEKRLRFQEYRRPNIINPLQRRFWSLSTSSSTSRRRVNILYLIPFNAVLGGAEIVDLDILRALKASGQFWITVATEFPAQVTRDSQSSQFESVAHEVFDVSLLLVEKEQRFHNFKKALGIVEYLAWSRRVDVVFNRNTFVGYALASLYKRQYNFTQIKFVDLIHLYEPVHGAWERESVPYHSLLDRRFVVSEDVREYIHHVHALPKEDFAVVYCGVDPDVWNVELIGNHLGILRKRLNVSRDFPIVGYHGRLETQKNPFLWLDVARHILTYRPETRFVIIGDGELAANLTKAVAAHRSLRDRVHFLGRVERSKVPAIVVDFSVLLSTSDFE